MYRGVDGDAILFGIDIEACARCGGKLRVIASIEEPEVIAKMLAHLGTHGAGSAPIRAAAWGEGTATTVQSALSSKVGVLAAGL